MTYQGRVKNGVVVFEGRSDLKEGTVVRIEPVEAAGSHPRGSAQAIMNAVRSGASWQGESEEMDRLLSELKEAKLAEVKAQEEKWRRNEERNPLDDE